ncbi:conserved Plasmodium protein, unknown function [Plasmodium relictum]|uniref:RNA-binding protein 25 n=1 Tax=Plasmodium relictum TaxID=85471 RepID=A0A1J1H7U4_PLARL|nr:conserved Plasmodium protein, unknown function [Plasmodium relictum]CRH01032.1 conserved Plasmodium protein, unknown function [Plasmodium relictum]
MINNRVYYSNLKLVVNKGEEEEKEEVENANNVIYVGNIDKYIEDNNILKILEVFGDIYKWHRQRNPSTNELMPFGFCEYSDIYGVYLCVNILDNIKLANKNLKVNCNDNLKKRFERIVDILYEKKQKAIDKQNELLNEEDMKNQILNDIKNDIKNKKNDVLVYIEHINNEYEEKKKKDEAIQNNTTEDEKNLDSEEKDKREKEEENLNINNMKLNPEQDNKNFINSLPSSNIEELNTNDKKKINNVENNENHDILGVEKKNSFVIDNPNNQQINNRNPFKRNASDNNNEEILKEKEKEEIKYLSKDYKVNWREKERIQRIENKEKDLEKDFYKREKEWLELEEQIKKDTYKEWNKLMLVKKKDIARLIELDLKGEYENSNISSSKKREIRNSKRGKEKELDELDRLNELKEIEEMKEKEKLKDEEKLINDNIQNSIEQEDVQDKEQTIEESKKEENNETKENFNTEKQKDIDEGIELDNEENRNNVVSEHSKNNIVYDFNINSDKDNEVKYEKRNFEHYENLKNKDNNFDNSENYSFNEYNENENIKKEKENNFEWMNYNNNMGPGVDCIQNNINIQNSENILSYRENNCDVIYKSENKGIEVLNKMCNENDTNKNNINESDSNNMNENKENENNTNKRKMISLEHINIKVNDKKKKMIDSENLNKINNPVLMNVFNTNDEDEFFTKNHQPLSKLDKHLDKKNQEEEKIKAIEIIENSKKILEKVPSTEEEIFNFHIEWNILNLKDNIGVKLKPWIYKKITEYIGKDEKEIIEEISNYFVQQILKETSPKDMLVEAEKFLDSDGKKFILNMYRLIIFEQLKIKNNL